MNLVEQIKLHISQNQLDSAFKSIKELSITENLKDKVIQIEGRFFAITEDKISGTVSEQEIAFALNRIRRDLLSLCTLIQENINANSSIENNKKYLINFDTIIQKKAIDFTGREWLFSSIEEHVEKNESGYIIIQGEPGIGKSAIASKIIKDQKMDCAYHFIVRASGINDTSQCLGNIMAQLIQKFDIQGTNISEKHLQNGGLLVDLLSETSKILEAQNKKLLLIIDGL